MGRLQLYHACLRPAILTASNAWKWPSSRLKAEMLGRRVKCLETAVASPAVIITKILTLYNQCFRLMMFPQAKCNGGM